MQADQLRPNVIVRGPIFPEPVQVIVTIPMGEAVKLIGKGLRTGQVHEPILERACPPTQLNPAWPKARGRACPARTADQTVARDPRVKAEERSVP